MRTWFLMAGLTWLAGCEMAVRNNTDSDSRGVEQTRADELARPKDCYPFTRELARAQESSSEGLAGRRPAKCPPLGTFGRAHVTKRPLSDPTRYTRSPRNGSERFVIQTLPQETALSTGNLGRGESAPAPAAGGAPNEASGEPQSPGESGAMPSTKEPSSGSSTAEGQDSSSTLFPESSKPGDMQPTPAEREAQQRRGVESPPSPEPEGAVPPGQDR